MEWCKSPGAFFDSLGSFFELVMKILKETHAPDVDETHLYEKIAASHGMNNNADACWGPGFILEMRKYIKKRSIMKPLNSSKYPSFYLPSLVHVIMLSFNIC